MPLPIRGISLHRCVDSKEIPVTGIAASGAET
jgi:hypothetical protein